MNFAYADSPYLGCCGLYGHRHEAPFGCWDEPETHALLIANMMTVRVDPIDIDTETTCYGCNDEPASTCVSASACVVVLCHAPVAESELRRRVTGPAEAKSMAPCECCGFPSYLAAIDGVCLACSEGSHPMNGRCAREHLVGGS